MKEWLLLNVPLGDKEKEKNQPLPPGKKVLEAQRKHLPCTHHTQFEFMPSPPSGCAVATNGFALRLLESCQPLTIKP